MARLMSWLRGMSLLVVLLSTACSKPSTTPLKVLPVPRSDVYLAGVADVDITPPLHLSLAGHGPEGRVATGFRLRLGCQAFVIIWDGRPFALVPCDLQSISGTLHRRVAERLQATGVKLGADSIFIMATHTHAGPAHYFESSRYSGPFSSIAPGYDEKVRDFLAERIVGGITTAFQSARPACLGWVRRDVEGLSFNRSYAPFLSNKSRGAGKATAIVEKASKTEAGGASTVAAPPGPAAAVDSSLYVLRINRRSGEACSDADRLLGALAVFGVHPTAVANTNELYHGDVFGFATRFARACLTESASPLASPLKCDDRLPSIPRDASGVNTPVIGLANGIEGDVSPRVDAQSMASSRELGRELGGHIARAVQQLRGKNLNDRPSDAEGRHLRSRFWQLHFPNGQFASETEQVHQLCQYPELGAASGSGAPDGPTRLRAIPETNAGFRLKAPTSGECHRYKIPLRLGLTHADNEFPLDAPIGLFEIDGLYLAMVPAEVTTVAGLRIRDAIAKVIGRQLPPWRDSTDASEHIAVVGLTNQYMSYVATEEEYDYQYYEGASTLYGHGSSRFLTRHFHCLAASLLDRDAAHGCEGQPAAIDDVPRFESDPSPIVSRFPAPEDDLRPPILVDPTPYVTHSDGDVGWGVTFPRLPEDFLADRSKFSVEIWAGKTSEQIIDDDRGSSIEVREVHGGDSWRVRWSPYLHDDKLRAAPLCEGWYRIAIGGRHRLVSKPFVLECDQLPGGRP